MSKESTKKVKSYVMPVVHGFVITAMLYSFLLFELKQRCDASCENIGMKHYWSVYGGCRVEDKPGRLIPLRNYTFVASDK